MEALVKIQANNFIDFSPLSVRVMIAVNDDGKVRRERVNKEVPAGEDSKPTLQCHNFVSLCLSCTFQAMRWLDSICRPNSATKWIWVDHPNQDLVDQETWEDKMEWRNISWDVGPCQLWTPGQKLTSPSSSNTYSSGLKICSRTGEGSHSQETVKCLHMHSTGGSENTLQTAIKACECFREAD